MGSESFVASLAGKFSSQSSRILRRDEEPSEFAASLERWSNCDLKTPFAVVQPANEQDVVQTVREALSASIPFVPASGGHSTWSSIGSEGIVIDLSRFKGVTVDSEARRVTVYGGTLMKEFQLALHPHKQFAGMPNNTGDGRGVSTSNFALTRSYHSRWER